MYICVHTGRKASSPPTTKTTALPLPTTPITPVHSQPGDFSADFSPAPAKRPNIPSAKSSFEQFRKQALEIAEKVCMCIQCMYVCVHVYMYQLGYSCVYMHVHVLLYLSSHCQERIAKEQEELRKQQLQQKREVVAVR